MRAHDDACRRQHPERVKPFLAVPAVVLALASLTACANPSLGDEAGELRRALAELPGVATVDLRYTEPVILDSGKLQLNVDMSTGADRDDIVSVVRAAYEEFSRTHRGEEGDLFVAVGDDTIHVRSFEPDADTDAVGHAAGHAITVLAAGSVRADINTQDVEASPHVFTSYSVRIAEQDADGVLRVLTSLEQDHRGIPDASWSVRTRDDESGWQLMSSSGFPNSQQRDLFNELRRDLPRGASILLTDDFATVQVPAEVTPHEVSRMAGRHLELLGGVQKAFYDVTSGENFRMMISVGDCTFAPDETGRRLEQDYGADCTKTAEPSP